MSRSRCFSQLSFILFRSTLLFLSFVVLQTLVSTSTSSAQTAPLSIEQFDFDATAEDGDPALEISNGVPVRMVYFSLVEGEVAWRGISENADDFLSEDTLEWSPASVNLPIRQGAQIWVPSGARAELRFDDGSSIRLGEGALLTLEELTSDAVSEYSALSLRSGVATLRLRHENSLYHLYTPTVSVRTRGEAKLRVDVKAPSTLNAELSPDAITDNEVVPVEVAVRAGQSQIEGDAGSITLRSGQFLRVREDHQFDSPGRLPAPDEWEMWNDERDSLLGIGEAAAQQHLPENIALVASELNQHGTWRDDAEYGKVWSPRVQETNWRPYYHGSWTWFHPFGWTWVSAEPWGWAPYHYGTWIHRPFGWGWVPGPARQPWCPAAVSFFHRNGVIAWAPLSPFEVRYPSRLPLCRKNSGWSRSFSIAAIAYYSPTSSRHCAPRYWNTRNINNVTYVNYNTYITKVRPRRERDNSKRWTQRADRPRFQPHLSRYATAAAAGKFHQRNSNRSSYVALSDGSALFKEAELLESPSTLSEIAGTALQLPRTENTERRRFNPPSRVTERALSQREKTRNLERTQSTPRVRPVVTPSHQRTETPVEASQRPAFSRPHLERTVPRTTETVRDKPQRAATSDSRNKRTLQEILNDRIRPEPNSESRANVAREQAKQQQERTVQDQRRSSEQNLRERLQKDQQARAQAQAQQEQARRAAAARQTKQQQERAAQDRGQRNEQDLRERLQKAQQARAQAQAQQEQARRAAAAQQRQQENQRRQRDQEERSKREEEQRRRRESAQSSQEHSSSPGSSRSRNRTGGR